MSDDNDDFFENFSTAPQDIAINLANVHYTNFFFFLFSGNESKSISLSKILNTLPLLLPFC